MTFNPALLFAFTDEITVEPFATLSAAQTFTYGPAVTYRALVQHGAKRVTNSQGREVVSNKSVIIPDRVHIDPRSRVTLPTGYIPSQSPIIGVEPLKGLDMDFTVIYV